MTLTLLSFFKGSNFNGSAFFEDGTGFNAGLVPGFSRFILEVGLATTGAPLETGNGGMIVGASASGGSPLWIALSIFLGVDLYPARLYWSKELLA
jgi:hypothetical protein